MTLVPEVLGQPEQAARGLLDQRGLVAAVRDLAAGGFRLSLFGYDFGEPDWYGAIYDESRRNKVMASSDMKSLRPVLKPQDWNEYVIRADGSRVTTWINGVLRGKHGITQGASEALDVQTLWIFFAVRPLNQPKPDNLAAGATVFAAAKAVKWWAIVSLGGAWTFRGGAGVRDFFATGARC